METLLDTISYKKHTIEVHRDIDPGDPRDWDNLGTMVCMHRRYKLGDDHDFQDSIEVERHLKENPAVRLPLYLYDHSGITMNTTGFSCKWDSGQVGIIYVTREKIREEYGWKYLTAKRLTKIREYLRNEVSTYDAFLTGEVYGYVVKDDTGAEIASCWGFYEKDYMITEAMAAIPE